MIRHVTRCFLAFLLVNATAQMKEGATESDLAVGGCCYNYYNEHKCPCVKDGGFPMSQCDSSSATWVNEGSHSINCTGKPLPAKPTEGIVTDDLGPAHFWTEAKTTHRLEEPCDDAPFCQDFATSAGSCYDSSGDPSSGHAVVCNVDEATCIGDGTRYSWFKPGYAMPDRDGVPTCCHCNAGCDHSKENAEMDCLHTVGYRDVTTKDCNRKDGVADREDANHDDLKDYTIGRKKCPIPKGASPDAGVVRVTSTPAAPTGSPEEGDANAAFHLHPRIDIFALAWLLSQIALVRHT